MASSALHLKKFLLFAICLVLIIGASGETADAGNLHPSRSLQAEENLPPIADAGGPYTGSEGAFLLFDGSGSVDPEGEELQFEWEIGSNIYTGEIAEVFFDDNFSGSVILTVMDPDGAVGLNSAEVTVINRLPVVEAFTHFIVAVGDNVVLQNVTFFDPGRADTHSATIDWGDGSNLDTGVIVEADGSGEIQGSHVFFQNGEFTVEICVTDDDGGVGCDTFGVTVFGTPEPTPTPSATPSFTPTATTPPTETPTSTATGTAIPGIQCNGLRLTDPRFRNDNFRVDITNDDPSHSFTLTSVLLYWPSAAQTLDWMRFDKTIFWNGNDEDPPTNTDIEGHWKGGPVTVFEPGDSRRFDVDFDHPGDLADFADIDDFSGTTFTFAEGCAITLGGEPKPTPTPYVPPEYPACPAGSELLGHFTDQLRRDKEPMSHSTPFELVTESEIWINGWVKEGHPERGCPGDPTCNQNQQHEDVVIEVDGVEFGYYEDADHGPEENAWYSSGPFEAPLAAGSHILTFRHSMHGSGPQSVNYLYSVCLTPQFHLYITFVVK